MKLFADLHIHIGRSGDGRPVKITASDSLTVDNILYEAAVRKGIEMVGLVDCGSPGVQTDLRRMLDQGRLEPLPGGGLSYRGKVTLIPGMEVETAEKKGAGHFVAYFPHLDLIKACAEKLARYITNMQLSTQRARLTVEKLWDLVQEFQGLIIPAHIFTPYKSVYGACCDSISELLRPDQLANLKAVELGLSSDTELASMIGELDAFSFLSNSDAHSLPKIGREYNLFQVQRADFKNLLDALSQQNECRILANFGFDPKLGKYHRTFCDECGRVARTPPPVTACPSCLSRKVVKGVLDRITELAKPGKAARPPYIHQVPLQFLPGVGPKTLEKLLQHFGTEMNVLHRTSQAELEAVAGAAVSRHILASRSGTLEISAGGGGVYGRVVSD